MTADRSADERGPLVLVVVAAVLALGAILAVLTFTGIGRPSGPRVPPRTLATRTARAWAAAWERGDGKRLGRLTTVASPAVASTVASFSSGLDAPGMTATVTGVRVVDDDHGVARIAVAFDMFGLGTWRYDTALPMLRTKRGEGDARWLVRWSPSVLHPDLTADTRVRRVVTWPGRAPLLDGDGTPIADSIFSAMDGHVGPASAARAAELGRWYRTGDVVGISGLEAKLERRLAGTPATEVRLLRGGRPVKVLAHFIGVHPTSLRLTLDPDVQTAAAAALDAGIAARQAVPGPPPPPAPRGAMVVLRPSTGGVLGIVSRPRGGFDRALDGHYPPGSTFKVVTTLGLLSKGITPTTTVTCPKSVSVGGREFSNAEDEEFGTIPFRTAFAHSCNTAFVQLASKLSAAELKAVADSLGFNRVPALPISVSASSMPLPHSDVDKAASAIGQARVSVTPFQMAMVAAAVAAGGVRDPHIVDDPPPALRAFAPGVQATLASLMRSVVSDGTGKKARVAGTPVAGKTGTAEFGVEDPPHVHAWFIAFRDDLAVAVILEDAGFGGDWAAPVAADFFRRMG